jgi:hypothetical protein
VSEPSGNRTPEAQQALLRAFHDLEACRAEKARQLPALLVDLVPTPDWIRLVARANDAQAAFTAAAHRFCLATLENDAQSHGAPTGENESMRGIATTVTRMMESC